MDPVMSSRTAALVVVMGSILLGCASAPRTPPMPSAAEQTAQVVSLPGTSGNVVCRDEAPTGSRIKHRVCITRAELRRVTKDAQEWLLSGGTRGAVTRVAR